MKQQIENILRQSASLKQAMLEDARILETIEAIVMDCIALFENKGQLLFGGNGGSAADAQHLAAEFSGRFYKDRAPLNAEALHVNTSYITAIGNDYSFDEIYARIIEAKGRTGDIFFAISTSGNSENILRAIDKAKEIGMKVVGLTGSSGGKMKLSCDHIICVPSDDTPRIQEAHIVVGHIICQLVEDRLFS